MSSTPALPDVANSGEAIADRSRWPKMFSRWLTVTTTTSPRFARREPRVRSEFADPYENAPPCSHTITGRLAASVPGVQTCRVRQSSESGDASGLPEKFTNSGRLPGRSPSCGERPPFASASRVPVQGTGGCGARKRLAPPVGAP